jgi:hypothetical protein
LSDTLLARVVTSTAISSAEPGLRPSGPEAPFNPSAVPLLRLDAACLFREPGRHPKARHGQIGYLKKAARPGAAADLTVGSPLRKTIRISRCEGR